MLPTRLPRHLCALPTNRQRLFRSFLRWHLRFGIDIEFKGEGLDEVGIDKSSGKTLVKINPKFYRPAEVDLLIGDPQKLMMSLDGDRDYFRRAFW